MTTQLPMSIPAVAKWYDDVERHVESARCTEPRCRECERLQKRMQQLKVKYASQLVQL